MGSLVFDHEKLGALTVPIGPEEIAWSYNLNTANIPTYGGEVVQILSMYIDDVVVKGKVKTYRQMEAIYRYFQAYMIRASQGEQGAGSFDQNFMKMTYTERNWTFYVQPLSVPGFKYSIKTVAPEWQLKAHVADTTAGNYEELEDMITTHVINNADFKLKGIVSPASADPTRNPFSAPGVIKNNQFVPRTVQEVEAQNSSLADYYNSLIPSYIEGKYESLNANLGSVPAYGRSQQQELEYEAKQKGEKK